MSTALPAPGTPLAISGVQQEAWSAGSEQVKLAGTMKAKKACPLAARIKRLMQADDDVGKISQATPVLLGAQRGGALGGNACTRRRGCCLHTCVLSACLAGAVRHAARAMELFLQRLCEKTAAVAQSRQAKTVSASHL